MVVASLVRFMNAKDVDADSTGSGASEESLQEVLSALGIAKAR